MAALVSLMVSVLSTVSFTSLILRLLEYFLCQLFLTIKDFSFINDINSVVDNRSKKIFYHTFFTEHNSNNF